MLRCALAPKSNEKVNHSTPPLVPLPAFSDNYIWLVHNGQEALVVDPGEADGVLAYLDEHHLRLQAILITHHHADHTGGVDALRAATSAHVYGPAYENLPEPVQRLDGGDHITVLGLDFEVLAVPGHTAGHIAYYCAEFGGHPLLFCGDTLFSAGCGRLFEGTPTQMLHSLDQLAALPADTRVCCTHEYTLSNLKFALAVEPDNADLRLYASDCEALRQRNLPTLPSSIGVELKINPFLRSREPGIAHAMAERAGHSLDTVGVFATLREWKNTFR